jgi:hypothetical protein
MEALWDESSPDGTGGDPGGNLFDEGARLGLFAGDRWAPLPTGAVGGVSQTAVRGARALHTLGSRPPWIGLTSLDRAGCPSFSHVLDSLAPAARLRAHVR